jgi:hypothetical protein
VIVMKRLGLPVIRSAVLLSLCSVGAACSSSSNDAAPVTDAASSVEAGVGSDAGDEDGGLSDDERTVFILGGGSLAINQEATSLANGLFDFDPTINPSATPAANATSIGQNIQQNLGTCGKVTVSGATVTVNFGPPPGCTLMNGPTVSGTVVLALSKSGGTTTIAATLTSVVVDGKPLSGTAQFATSNGSTFALTTALTSGTQTDTANLAVTGSANELTLSGTAKEVNGGLTTSLTFTNVTHVDGECYATSGTMTIGEGPIAETITFNASTPATGMVTVQTGKHTSTELLPAYGSCPSDGKDGG